MTPSAYERWLALYDASATRDAAFSTMSGVPLDPVYGPDDGEFPGLFPYTRGVHASMYRSRLWTMRMFAGFGTAVDTNQRFKEIIAAGGQGLSTAFDMPTLLGLDSDDPMALLFLGLAALTFAVKPRSSAGLGYGLVAIAFVWQLFGGLLGAPRWLLDLSPFQHVGLVPAQPFKLGAALIMLVLAALACTGAVWLFQRRDLAGA